MSVTVATQKLIDTLSDALRTASDFTGGVHIGTYRAPWRDEPGDVDLLAATATTKTVLGHTWIPCDGRLEAAVWPTASTEAALALCKKLFAVKGKQHTVDIDMVLADPPEDAKDDSHPGWIVTVRESPALWDSDTKLDFHAHHETAFPIQGVHRMLTGGTKVQEDYEDAPLTLWSAAVLAPLVAIAQRRKMQIQLFRSQERRMQLVQIGDTWIGAAVPATPLPGDATDLPSIDPVLPSSDTIAADLLKHGFGLFTGDTPDTEVAGEQGVIDETLLPQAVELVVATGFASPAMLQRKLKIGYAQSTALLDEMHNHGIVGPAEGSKARDVHFKPTELARALSLLGAETD